MKTVIAFIAIALATAFALTGCMNNGDTFTSGDSVSSFTELYYKHSDGTTMKCLRYDRGITCDWSNNPKTEGTTKK